MSYVNYQTDKQTLLTGPGSYSGNVFGGYDHLQQNLKLKTMEVNHSASVGFSYKKWTFTPEVGLNMFLAVFIKRSVVIQSFFYTVNAVDTRFHRHPRQKFQKPPRRNALHRWERFRGVRQPSRRSRIKAYAFHRIIRLIHSSTFFFI